MKVLLSAYACEPHKGSEPEIGWRWAMELAKRGHDVCVITRANNRTAIEGELGSQPTVNNLRFFYYDLPPALRHWKKGNRGIRLYYLLWQIGAYRKAQDLHRRYGFDCVHHVTFVSMRQPSFMGLLGIPFIFGPAGGGERAPFALRRGYPLRGWFLDLLRDLANGLSRMDPLLRVTFASAHTIYATSSASQALIPRSQRHKSLVRSQLALPIQQQHIDSAQTDRGDIFKLLYVGRLVYWKGLHLGLQAMQLLLSDIPQARLTIIGSGPDEAWLKDQCRRAGIAHAVEWIGQLARPVLLDCYSSYDALLFPSLHDSGGFVVLEAMAFGLPVVCLDLGGPGVLVTSTSGRAVATANKNQQAVVHALYTALRELAENPSLQKELGAGARLRAQHFTWDTLVAQVYTPLEQSTTSC